MRLEKGKTYRANNGRKVGPMTQGFSMDPLVWHQQGANGLWNEDGSSHYEQDAQHRDSPPLIAEWTEGPVRTVTRCEIVPGRYGYVVVVGVGTEGVTVQFAAGPSPILIAPELRAAAATFLELAEALEDVG